MLLIINAFVIKVLLLECKQMAQVVGLYLKKKATTAYVVPSDATFSSFPPSSSVVKPYLLTDTTLSNERTKRRENSHCLKTWIHNGCHPQIRVVVGNNGYYISYYLFW